MDKLSTKWTKQLDDFDKVLGGLPALDETAQMWGAFAPAVPALYRALVKEVDVYQVTAGALRAAITADAAPLALAERVRDTIFASRRLKGLIDAYNREKAVAEAAFPEMAAGSLKETPVAGLGVSPALSPAAPEVPTTAGSPSRAAPSPPSAAPAAANGPPGSARV